MTTVSVTFREFAVAPVALLKAWRSKVAATLAARDCRAWTGVDRGLGRNDAGAVLPGAVPSRPRLVAGDRHACRRTLRAEPSSERSNEGLVQAHAASGARRRPRSFVPLYRDRAGRAEASGKPPTSFPGWNGRSTLPCSAWAATATPHPSSRMRRTLRDLLDPETAAATWICDVAERGRAALDPVARSPSPRPVSSRCTSRARRNERCWHPFWKARNCPFAPCWSTRKGPSRCSGQPEPIPAGSPAANGPTPKRNERNDRQERHPSHHGAHPPPLAAKPRNLSRADRRAWQAAPPTARCCPAAISPMALPCAARARRWRSAATRCPTSASSPPTTTCCRRISHSRPIRP